MWVQLFHNFILDCKGALVQNQIITILQHILKIENISCEVGGSLVNGVIIYDDIPLKFSQDKLV